MKKKRFVSVSVRVVTALTLLLAGVDVASGFTTGNEVDIHDASRNGHAVLAEAG